MESALEDQYTFVQATNCLTKLVYAGDHTEHSIQEYSIWNMTIFQTLFQLDLKHVISCFNRNTGITLQHGFGNDKTIINETRILYFIIITMQ